MRELLNGTRPDADDALINDVLAAPSQMQAERNAFGCPIWNEKFATFEDATVAALARSIQWDCDTFVIVDGPRWVGCTLLLGAKPLAWFNAGRTRNPRRLWAGQDRAPEGAEQPEEFCEATGPVAERGAR